MNYQKTLVGSIGAFLLVSGTTLAQPPGPSETFALLEATIADVHAAMSAGRITCRELVQRYLDRIEAYDKQGPHVNAVQTINPRALEEADRLEAALAQVHAALTYHYDNPEEIDAYLAEDEA
jgi:hypothetical protein